MQSPSKQCALLAVEGMTCGACSSTVERALSSMPGVQSANVSCISHQAQVVFDATTTTPEALAGSIEAVGFDAVVVEVCDKHAQTEVGSTDIQSKSQSIELKIHGMTCSACSGTVERHLRKLPGVERAIVSLVLHTAFIKCSADRPSAEHLCSEIEDLGFDAEVVTVASDSAQARCGRANMHVQVHQGQPRFSLVELARRCQNVPGVLSCQPTISCYLRLVYDPNIVGARHLLEQLKHAWDEDTEVKWVNVNSENEHLQRHIAEMSSLQKDLLWAAPPAAIVFLLTVVLPSVGIGHDHLGILSFPLHHGVDVFCLLIMALATPVQFYVGQRFHRAAFRALKRKSPNMDVLVSVATNTAYFYSAFLVCYCLLMPEMPSSHSISMQTGHFFTMAPILIAVVLGGKSLEARAKLSAMQAMAELPNSAPASAVLCGSDSNESTIPLELVELSDVLRVFAGAKIAVDGMVYSETNAYVDESLITGESDPVLKCQGDLVMGGTTCVSGGFLMRVSKVGCDTALGQMYRLVQEAQASKAEVQRTADQVARVFVPSVISLAFITFLMWSALTFGGLVTPDGLNDHATSEHWHASVNHVSQGQADYGSASLKLLFAMKFGMSVLMIACPCAMGLATPMAVMVATSVAAKRGCLVKSASALESSARLRAIVLDKTGTVTEGAPTVQAAACIPEAIQDLLDRFPFPGCNQSSSGQLFLSTIPMTAMGTADNVTPRHVEALFWWLLRTLESASDHPVAKCIVAALDEAEGLPVHTAPSNFECISGRGVQCIVEQLGGCTARVGNLSFYEETRHSMNKAETEASQKLMAWISAMQQQGHTVVVVHVDSQLLGAVALRDPIRDDAEWVVGYLTNKLGLEVWMCSGDNAATVQSVAREVGIKHVVAEALPLTKSQCIQNLQHTGQRVGFVGDGINDAPALAEADVGIAIGVGAQIAVEAADVTLVRSELSECVAFLCLSKATFRTVLLNFFWAFCFNFVMLPVAAGVFYPSFHVPPLAAGIAMAISSCLVVVSSLQLRRFRGPVQPEQTRRKRARTPQKRYRMIHESDRTPLAAAREDVDPPGGAQEPFPQSIGLAIT